MILSGTCSNMAYKLYLNALIRGRSAIDKVGMVESHAAAFMRIARQENCVISSRELGKACTGLAEEGYDSKGFRIKGKTCNFGPMAGFVCRNPSFSKKGADYAPKQEKDHLHALRDDDGTGWKASLQQICISDYRLQWLKANGYADPQVLSKKEETLWGTVKDPVKMTYLMRKEVQSGDTVWALYETAEPLESKPVLRLSAWDVLAKKPMDALVNPYPAWKAGHYKNAVTGDYDLFAVWPRRSEYDPMGEDRRIAGMASDPRLRDALLQQWEDRKLGNISNRIHQIAQLVNSVLPKPGGCTRDMLHHSDEGGRPGVTGVELPVIAFVPGPENEDYIVAMDNLLRMNAFAKMCHELGFQLIVNTGWRAQLGTLGDTGDPTGWQTPLNDPARGR